MVMRVRIESRNLMNYLETEKAYWDRFGQRILETVRDKGLEIYQQEVPKGPTRRLWNSLFADIQENKVIFGYDLRIAPHAEHIDGYGRTARSEGRYVPAIHRRLVRPSKRNPRIGWHPGSRKTPFTERTMVRLEQLVEQILTQGIRGVIV